MDNKKTMMSREDVFAWIKGMASAAIAGEAHMGSPPAGTWARKEDLIDASNDFLRGLSQRFDTIPAQVSDDIKMQEALRVHFDEVLSGAEPALRTAIAKIPGEPEAYVYLREA